MPEIGFGITANSKYRLVVFDFDGTLSNSFPWFLQAMNRAAAKFHFRPVEPHEVEAVRGLGTRQILAFLQLAAWKVPFVARFMRREMAAAVSDIRLFEGVDEMLAALTEQGIDVAILSSNSEYNVHCVLGRTNKARVKYFECGVSAFGKRKRLRKLLKTARVRAGDALYVGDEVRDAEAAHAEEIAFVGVSWGYSAAGALQPLSGGPLLSRMSDLVDLLRR